MNAHFFQLPLIGVYLSFLLLRGGECTGGGKRLYFPTDPGNAWLMEKTENHSSSFLRIHLH